MRRFKFALTFDAKTLSWVSLQEKATKQEFWKGEGKRRRIGETQGEQKTISPPSSLTQYPCHPKWPPTDAHAVATPDATPTWASRQKVLPWDQNWILWHTNPTLDCELLPLSLTNILFKRAFKNRSVEACVTNLSHSTLIYRWPTRHPDKLDIHQWTPRLVATFERSKHK